MLVEGSGNLTLCGDSYIQVVFGVWCLVFIVVDISFERCGRGKLICF